MAHGMARITADNWADLQHVACGNTHNGSTIRMGRSEGGQGGGGRASPKLQEQPHGEDKPPGSTQHGNDQPHCSTQVSRHGRGGFLGVQHASGPLEDGVIPWSRGGGGSIRGSPARQPSPTNSISGALQATVCGRTAGRAERGCRMLEGSQLVHLHLQLQQLPPVHPYPGTERAQNHHGASRAALTREQAGYSRLEAIHRLLTNSVRSPSQS